MATPLELSPGPVLVLGQIARDLILAVGPSPESGGSTPVRERLEQLGGKGANQAVGLAQLGADIALLGVVGSDDVGARLLEQAHRDGLGTEAVFRRGESALLVDVLDDDGPRLLEHVPDASVLTRDDVRRARAALREAGTVSLQLQQPADALIEAASIAAESGAAVVLDGSAPPEVMDALLPHAALLRADAHEARLLTEREMTDEDTAVAAARRYLDRGLQVVALGVESVGDVVAWPGGHRLYRFEETQTVDTTGAGDAFVAGLLAGLRAGWHPERAGGLAARCAASTVQRLGGRPDLTALRPEPSNVPARTSHQDATRVN